MDEYDKLIMLFNKKNILTCTFLGAALIVCPIVVGQYDAKPETKFYKESSKSSSNMNAVDTVRRIRKHSPHIATIASTIFPGLGQAYNRKYWKAPIIWGAGIALYTYYEYNNNHYHRIKTAKKQQKDGLEITDPELKNYTGNFQIQQDKYFNRKTAALIYLGLLYFANIIDANVDAHMFDYDVSDDLSLHWEPTLTPPNPNTYSATTVGIKIQLIF